jgi:hypothetical protein
MKNTIFSEFGNLKIIKFKQVNKVSDKEINFSEDKIKILNIGKERLNNFRVEDYQDKDKYFPVFVVNKLPIIISFSAFSIGFIFAGIFMVIAFLSSEYLFFQLNFD